MRFYEIREAGDDLGVGVTLAHDETFAPTEFLAMVEAIRSRIVETYPDETLVEAIARELEEHHGFFAALDHALVAAVAVSDVEGETTLIGESTGDTAPNGLEESDDDDPDLQLAATLLAGSEPTGVRTALVDLDGEAGAPHDPTE